MPALFFNARSPSDKFPNYFETNNAETNALIQTKVTQAISSILKRIDIPFILDTNTGVVKRHGFFVALEEEIHKVDKNAKVYVSGGVIRSLLGYIYRKIHAEHLKRGEQGQTAIQVLDRLIQGTARKKHESEVSGESSSDDEMSDSAQSDNIAVPSLSALGIGSDLDILIDFSEDVDAKTKREILTQATDFINSMETHMELRDASNIFKKTIVPVGDVKEYQAQIERATEQAGVI